MHRFLISLLVLLLQFSMPALGATNPPANEQIRKCMEAAVLSASENMTIKELKNVCTLLTETNLSNEPTQNIADLFSANTIKINKDNNPAPEIITTPITATPKQEADSLPENRLLKDRLTIEELNRSNRFALTPNKRNYLIPLSYSNSPANEPYVEANDNYLTKLRHTEAELQLSVKILLRENIFNESNGHLYLGYTNHAIWQVYNKSISAPFRESDHQPELMLTFSNDWEIGGFRNSINEISLNHQSNGQSGELSRSWNRIMFTSIFEKDNIALAFTPWYRLPENKQDPDLPRNPRNDDNPDITTYMGNFELTGAYKFDSSILSLMLRNNLDHNNYGAVEASWTFPVTATMRGFVNYFDGYGHSLIEYNLHQQVVGLGIIFTDFF